MVEIGWRMKDNCAGQEKPPMQYAGNILHLLGIDTSALFSVMSALVERDEILDLSPPNTAGFSLPSFAISSPESKVEGRRTWRDLTGLWEKCPFSAFLYRLIGASADRGDSVDGALMLDDLTIRSLLRHPNSMVTSHAQSRLALKLLARSEYFCASKVPRYNPTFTTLTMGHEVQVKHTSPPSLHVGFISKIHSCQIDASPSRFVATNRTTTFLGLLLPFEADYFAIIADSQYFFHWDWIH
ncbi:hypothetical protein EDD85DRAFT_798170 [Armillaria nabsnona]|nr:hypothetical protein EDD85DRAFT_798170 [Armillaria nabsnona]